MLRPKVNPVALGAVLVLLGTVVFAQATREQPKGSAVPQTSLAQAIRIAEQETGGRARKIEIERKRGVDVYEIKTVGKDKSIKVLVEPMSGKVLSLSGAGVFASIANLFALTAGPLPPTPPALLARKQLPALLAELAGEFEWVLVDSPPLALRSSSTWRGRGSGWLSRRRCFSPRPWYGARS